MALTDKLSAVADAIRGKTGKTETMTLDQMPTEIAGIQAGGGGIGAVKFIDVDITVEASTTTKVDYTVDGLEFISFVENPASVNGAFTGDEAYVSFITPKEITGTLSDPTNAYNCTLGVLAGNTNYAKVTANIISYGASKDVASQNYGIYGMMLTCTAVKDGKKTGNMQLSVRHNSAGSYEVAAGTYNVQVWMLNDFDWGHKK